MRILHVSLFLFFLSNSTFLAAQRAVAIELEKMNVVYRGVLTPMTIVLNDSIFRQLQVIPSQVELTRQGLSDFKWEICHREGHTAHLIIFDSLTQQPIDTHYFRVKDLHLFSHNVLLFQQNRERK